MLPGRGGLSVPARYDVKSIRQTVAGIRKRIDTGGEIALAPIALGPIILGF